MTARRIIIDTDPGQDDALAILLALASPELEVVGITCVAGNVPLELTSRNARLLCQLAGRPDVAVFAGCDRPLQRPLVTAEAVHGRTGLDGATLPDLTMALRPEHAVDWIIATLLEAEPGEVTICPIGPLTNIATALQREPGIAERIDRIVMMGGSYFAGGNVTPAAEFNVYADPHAADVVFRSGVPLVVMPLDVTHEALLPPGWIDSVRSLGTDAARTVADLLSYYDHYDPERYGDHGRPLHDPATIAYLLRPELYRGKDVYVAVETSSELTMGATVVDYWRGLDRRPNCTWVTEVDAHEFFALLLDRLRRLPAH